MKDCEIVSPFNFTFVKVLFMVRITKKNAFNIPNTSKL